MTTEPVPQPLYSGSRRHIARPDHPRGTRPTNVAFCGAVATPISTKGPAEKLPACIRCASAWVAYVDRLAREERGETE